MHTITGLQNRFRTSTKQLFSKKVTGYRSNGIQQQRFTNRKCFFQIRSLLFCRFT